MTPDAFVALVPHPACADSRSVGRLAARVERVGPELSVTFELEGDLRRLTIPAPGVPRPVDGLWRSTCFEAFVALDGAPAYHELNFSPSGEWGAYVFRGYRDGAFSNDPALAPGIVAKAEGSLVTLTATVDLRAMSPEHVRAPLRVALAAVVETEGRLHSFWSLRHPSGKPDFHHPEGFAIRLAPPESE